MWIKEAEKILRSISKDRLREIIVRNSFTNNNGNNRFTNNLFSEEINYSSCVLTISALIKDCDNYHKYNLNKDYLVLIESLKSAVADHKIQNALYTFDDLIYSLVGLITSNPFVLRRIREMYSCVLIDEFQDTDKYQWQIFNKLFLIPKKFKLFLIGDPKQAIYSFRAQPA